MRQISRARCALVSGAIIALVGASCAVAGAATSTKGTFNPAAAKLVPTVYKTGTLQVASDATYKPDEFMSGSNVVGFDVDLIKAIATTLGIKVKETNATFSGILLGVQTNKFQIGNSSFTDNKKREKQVNFVDYFKAGEGLYAKSNSTITINGLTSLCGLKVAVETTTVEQTDAQNTAKTCPSNKKLTVLTYSTQTEADLAVSTGAANVGFLDSQIASYVVSKSAGVFKLVGSAINVAPYGIATQKNPHGLALAKAIQAALKVLIANGTYHAILAKWGVTAGAVPVSKIVLNGAIS